MRAGLAFRLFLGVLLVYLILSPGRIGGSDTTEMLRLTESLLEGGVAVEPVPGWSWPGADGRFYSRYGLGYPLALAPFCWLGEKAGALVGRFPPRYVARFAASLVNPLLAAGSVALLFLVLSDLGFSRRRSAVLAGAFGFSTSVLVHSKEGMSEPAAMLCLLLAYLSVRRGALRDRPAWTGLGAAAAGAAVLTRPMMVLVPVALAVLFLTVRRWAARPVDQIGRAHV
jgi:hypothetical protein